jgi:hypothetical protein
MELFDDISRETKRTEEEIRKAEMRKEIGELKDEINRAGHEVSQELRHETPAPAPADDDK